MTIAPLLSSAKNRLNSKYPLVTGVQLTIILFSSKILIACREFKANLFNVSIFFL